MLIRYSLSALALAIPALVSAQASPAVAAQAAVATTPAASMATIVTPTAPSVLRSGMPIPMKLAEALTTEHKLLRVGQRVNLQTAEAVMLNGQIVIPADSPGVGEITEVRNKGMWGKSGHFTGRVLSLRANGRQVRLSGQFDDKGVTGTGAVVGAILFVPVVGFFTTGTSARLPLGAPVNAFLDEDLEIAPAR